MCIEKEGNNMSETSARRLAAMLSESQRAEVLQLARVIEQQRAGEPEICEGK